jgi:hypothetical protein
MPKNISRAAKILSAGLLIIVSLVCLFLVAYPIIRTNEQKICYGKLAAKYNVESTYISIGNEYLHQINQNVAMGMTEQKVIAEISKIAPVTVVDAGYDGINRSQIRLDVCKLNQNNFIYLIRYNNGKFVDIELDSGN